MLFVTGGAPPTTYGVLPPLDPLHAAAGAAEKKTREGFFGPPRTSRDL